MDVPYLSFHPLIDIRVVSTSWLSCVMSASNFTSSFLFWRPPFSFHSTCSAESWLYLSSLLYFLSLIWATEPFRRSYTLVWWNELVGFLMQSSFFKTQSGYLTIFQFSSVTQSCPTLCDPMDCSTPGLPIHHQRPEFPQTQVHWVGDAIQPSHPLSSPSPPAFNLSQHQGLFQWVGSSHQVAKVLEFQLQHQSF